MVGLQSAGHSCLVQLLQVGWALLTTGPQSLALQQWMLYLHSAGRSCSVQLLQVDWALLTTGPQLLVLQQWPVHSSS